MPSNHFDLVRATLRHKNIAARIHGHAERGDHRDLGGHAIAADSLAAAAGDRGDDAIGTHFADYGVAGIGDKQRIVGGDGDIFGTAQTRETSRPRVAIETRITGARVEADGAIGRHLPDSMIARGADINVAGGIHRHSHGDVQVGVGGRTGIAPETGNGDEAVAGKGGDGAARIHLAHPVVERVRNINIARRIERDALRRIQLSIHGGAAVSPEPGARIARDQGQGPTAIQFENGVSAAEIEIAAGHRDLVRLADRSVHRRSRCGGRRAPGYGGYGVLLGKRNRAARQQQGATQFDNRS